MGVEVCLFVYVVGSWRVRVVCIREYRFRGSRSGGVSEIERVCCIELSTWGFYSFRSAFSFRLKFILVIEGRRWCFERYID